MVKDLTQENVCLGLWAQRNLSENALYLTFLISNQAPRAARCTALALLVLLYHVKSA
jgi:hypothetical protein